MWQACSICLWLDVGVEIMNNCFVADLKLQSLLSESARSAVARKSASDLCCTGDA